MSDEVDDDEHYPSERVPLNLVKAGTSTLGYSPKLQAERKELLELTETESIVIGDVSEDEVVQDSKRVTKDFKKESRQSTTHTLPMINQELKKQIDQNREYELLQTRARLNQYRGPNLIIENVFFEKP